MGYIQPIATLVDFELDLDGKRYKAPTQHAVSFDLGTQGAPPVPSLVPGLLAEISASWNLPPETDVTVQSRHQVGIEADLSVQINSDQASKQLQLESISAWNQATRRDIEKAAPWGTGKPLDQESRSKYSNATPVDIEHIVAPWEPASQILDMQTRAPFKALTPYKDRTVSAAHFRVDEIGLEWKRERNLPGELAKQRVGRADFGFLIVRVGRLGRETDLPLVPPFVPHAIQPADSDMRLPWGGGIHIDTDMRLPWGPAGYRDTTLDFTYEDYTGPITDPGDVVIAIEREAHCFMNTVNVKRVSDDTPIDMQDITITLDVDSWAWAITGTVVGTASLAIIEPTGAGLIDIEVEINGHIWIFMIESYSGNRKFADERFVVQGVSKTQLLAAPYAAVSSKKFDVLTQAGTIIDDELFGTGFTISFNTTASWSVDADAFSFQELAPIAVASRIAEAAGAILVPHKSLQELTIQPRWKISPWVLTGSILGDLDAQIPMSMVSNQALVYEPAQLIDSVYISGTTKGVSALVERFGSGGVAPGADIFDDLMTDTDVLQERARQAIADSGNKGMYTLTMAVPEFVTAPGLLEPGMMVEVVEGPAVWRGYILGTSITAPRSGSAKVEQTVNIVRFFEHE